jgi:hypothetical protein
MSTHIASLLLSILLGTQAMAEIGKCPKDKFFGDAQAAPVFEKMTSSIWDLMVCGSVKKDHGSDI